MLRHVHYIILHYVTIAALVGRFRPECVSRRAVRRLWAPPPPPTVAAVSAKHDGEVIGCGNHRKTLINMRTSFRRVFAYKIQAKP
jgi:hypothetical protein